MADILSIHNNWFARQDMIYELAAYVVRLKNLSTSGFGH